MTNIEDIKKPIISEFRTFEEHYNAVFETENDMLESIFEHILKGKGKRIRPILVLLAAKLCGEVSKQTIDAAIALELLHTATLIHDDVVDETYKRRGNPSVNAIWDNKVAVLAGDYTLSNALYVAVKTRSFEILDLISSIGKDLADGELQQLHKAKQAGITEEIYYQIIRKKTALLFSVCTGSGAISAGASELQKGRLAGFGEFLGMCFQIQDDIFDYSEDQDIGKPVGNDIREGKVTLPLIMALEKADEKERREITAILLDKDFTTENIDKILRFTRSHNGIELAREKMKIYKKKAVDELGSFEDSPVKTALLLALEYTTKRNK